MLLILGHAGTTYAQDFRGTGRQMTLPFPLQVGLARFDVEHAGDGEFVVLLLDGAGNVVERLVRAMGPVRASTAVRISGADSYLFDVRASGGWSIRLREDAAGAGIGPVRDSFAEGHDRGLQAARQRGAAGWLGGGFAGGLVLGPLGTGAVFVLAGSRDTRVPQNERADFAGRDPEYIAGFEESFRNQLSSERRVAALVGGAIGTAVNAMFWLYISNRGAGRAGEPLPEAPVFWKNEELSAIRP